MAARNRGAIAHVLETDAFLWHLGVTRGAADSCNIHANVVPAWQKTRGEEVTIAVIDDAIDLAHPDLSAPGKVVHPYDAIHDLPGAVQPAAHERHGTCCAGIACASGTSGAPGVAPAASLMPVRADPRDPASVVRALDWAGVHSADIVLCCWAPPGGYWRDPSDPLHRARQEMPIAARGLVEQLGRHGRCGRGAVVVWAAGNRGRQIEATSYPAHSHVLAVTACSFAGRRVRYASFGDAIVCCFPSSDTFGLRRSSKGMHPSMGLWTIDRPGAHGYNPGGKMALCGRGDTAGLLTVFGGTSAAASGFAGVVALMLSVNPDLSPRDVRNVVSTACHKIDPLNGAYDSAGHSRYFGYGLIDASEAVKRAEQLAAPALHRNVESEQP